VALAARKLSEQQALPELDVSAAMEAAPMLAPVQPAAAFEAIGWVNSPARDLQEQLNLAFTEPAPLAEGEKWSSRRTLVFVVGASALLWGAIIGGVALLLG